MTDPSLTYLITKGLCDVQLNTREVQYIFKKCGKRTLRYWTNLELLLNTDFFKCHFKTSMCRNNYPQIILSS